MLMKNSEQNYGTNLTGHNTDATTIIVIFNLSKWFILFMKKTSKRFSFKTSTFKLNIEYILK